MTFKLVPTSMKKHHIACLLAATLLNATYVGAQELDLQLACTDPKQGKTVYLWFRHTGLEAGFAVRNDRNEDWRTQNSCGTEPKWYSGSGRYGGAGVECSFSDKRLYAKYIYHFGTPSVVREVSVDRVAGAFQLEERRNGRDGPVDRYQGTCQKWTEPKVETKF